MAEIAENLSRRELSPPERDAQTARMAALLVKGGKKAAKQNGQRGPSKKKVGGSPSFSEPTAVEEIAEHTGISSQTAARRIKSAAKAAGVEVNLATATADELLEIADKAAERVEQTKAERVEKAKGKHAPARKAREDVKKIEADDAAMNEEQRESYDDILEALNWAEATWGRSFAQAAVRSWWLSKPGNEKGEVRFNPTSYQKGV